MSEQPRYTYQFTDESATVVVLNSLVRDMKHTLEWLAVAQFCMAVVNFIHFLGAVVDHAWISAGFDGLLTAAFGAWALATSKRAAKYGSAR